MWQDFLIGTVRSILWHSCCSDSSLLCLNKKGQRLLWFECEPTLYRVKHCHQEWWYGPTWGQQHRLHGHCRQHCSQIPRWSQVKETHMRGCNGTFWPFNLLWRVFPLIPVVTSCFSWLYNLFSKFIDEALRNALQKQVCTAHCILVRTLSEALLRKYPFTMESS